MADDIVLITPTLSLAEDFARLAREHLAHAERRYEEALRDVRAYVRQCEDLEAGHSLPAGWVRQSTFWLVRGGERILGCSRLRHHLTPALAFEGGHIGYDIRPDERGHGYGSLIL